MVTLFVAGKAVGTLADAARLLPQFFAQRHPVEFRDDGGALVGRFFPEATEEAREADPDWVRAITPEETARRSAEPGYTFDEMKKRLGWE